MAQEADAPPPANVDSIYLAKDDGTGQAGDAASSFVPTDIPIYCVVMLDSTTPVTIRMNLVAAKVTGVKADSKVLSVSYTTKDGQNRVNFTGRPTGKWVVVLIASTFTLMTSLYGTLVLMCSRRSTVQLQPRRSRQPRQRNQALSEERIKKFRQTFWFDGIFINIRLKFVGQ
jgi:hypothetical protein